MSGDGKKSYGDLCDLQGIVVSVLERVVAAEPKENGTAELFIRDGDKIERKTVPFRPFMLLSAPPFLEGVDAHYEVSRLKGKGVFSFLAKFADIPGHEKAVRHIKKTSGTSPTAPNSPCRIFNDMTQQLLTAGKFRLFRGMSFGEIRRMQVDIETLCTEGYEFSNAEREGDKIAIISMSDSTGWEQALVLGKPYSEKELLEKFVQVLIGRDPDVIEGHNIFRFDLPYIEERARRHKVRLNLGRDGSLMDKRPSRISIAERQVNYSRYEIYGRHVIDTYYLTMLYDVSHRDLEDYGLKSLAVHFGIASRDRTYIDGGGISDTFKKDPDLVVKYALDDVRETRALSAILSPSYFYQTQLIPYSYQSCAVRGNATRIDAMLVAAYLDSGTAVSAPEGTRAFVGALTEAFHAGVFKGVWHCDVRSLYPSIILAEKWCPKRDELGVFPEFLAKLRDFRLLAKDAERKAGSKEQKDYFNALQTTFKILINSFYGYLGFSQGTFNDFAMAEKVTAKGRDILSSMKDFLEKSGANVIEMDTDGIYFQPPPKVTDTDKMRELIQSVLPAGIEVELDETYHSMFCYKSKNYALLTNDGEVAMTGAALKSRGLEPFQRDYMRNFVEFLLKEDFKAIGNMISEYRDAIQNRKWPLANLAKTETLQDSPESYKRKLESGEGKRSAAYELALKSGTDYRAGDQISYYITGDKKKASAVDNCRLLKDAPEQRDENVAYYLAKLDELVKKFAEFVPPDKKHDPEQPGLF